MLPRILPLGRGRRDWNLRSAMTRSTRFEDTDSLEETHRMPEPRHRIRCFARGKAFWCSSIKAPHDPERRAVVQYEHFEEAGLRPT